MIAFFIPFTWQHLGLFVLCLANLGLGAVVYLNNPTGATNRLFLLTVLAVVGWISSITLSLSSPHLSVTVFLGRLAFAFATALPFVLLWLFSTFRKHPSHRSLSFCVEALLGAAFIALSFSPLILAGATHSSSRPNFIYGPLHPILALYLVTCLAHALLVLARTIRTSTGLVRLQLLYLLAAVTLGGAGILTTNLLVPLIWRTSYYSIFGPYFTLLFLSLAAHAILRHRLMDVRLFVARSVVYISAIALVSLVFSLLATAAIRLTTDGRDSVSLTTAVILALITAIIFQPTRRLLQNAFNRYLYRRPYDSQKLLREVSDQLSKSLDPISLVKYLVLTLSRLVQCERVVAYVAASHGTALARTAFEGGLGGSDTPLDISVDSDLVFHLRQSRAPLLADDLGTSPDTLAASRLASSLSSFGATAAFPLLYDRDLIAVLLFGPKRSGDAYFAEDIDLISTLLSPAAIALKNAQLYSQILLAHEHIENIITTMESAVIAVARDGIITLFNDAGVRLLGISRAEVRGRSCSVLPADLFEPIQATLRDGLARLQLEKVLHLPTATRPISVIISTSTLRDRAGDIVGVVAVISDTTQLKHLEAEKRRSERLASIGVLAAGIAHEIKNPLVAIKTFAELLPERFSDPDFRDQFSKLAVTEIERIDELVDRLRSLVTPPPQRLVPIAVCDLIDETLTLLTGHIQRAAVIVETRYPSTLSFVPGDRSQLKQLFLNLLLNAIEAMPNGGRLEIDVRHCADDSVVIDIRDSGEGLRADIAERLFDPFVTTKANGSGLGLSICRGIVEAHGAHMKIGNSVNGPGATVTLVFPRCTAADVEGRTKTQMSASL